MADLTTKSKTELATAYQRAMSTLKNSKEQAKAITGRTVNTVLTAGAGYGVGALRKHMGDPASKKVFIPGTQVEADLAFGILASVAGIIGIADEYSPQLCAVGGGTLAAYAAITAMNS